MSSRVWKIAFIAGVALLLSIDHFSQAQSRLQREQRVLELARLKWIAYAPTHFDPRRSIFPTDDSIGADLSAVKAVGFDGIITYESGGRLANVPRIAAGMGLKVIQGV